MRPWLVVLVLTACGHATREAEVSDTPVPAHEPAPATPGPDASSERALLPNEERPAEERALLPEEARPADTNGFDVRARVALGTPGCVGMTRDGREVLVIADSPGFGGPVRKLLWQRLAPEPDSKDTMLGSCRSEDAESEKDPTAFCERELMRDALSESRALDLELGTTWVACKDVAGRAAALPLGQAVRVNQVARSVGHIVARAGTRSFDVVHAGLEAIPDGFRKVSVERLHFADDAPGMFVETSIGGDGSEGGSTLYGVSLEALGIAPCVPRPHRQPSPVSSRVPARADSACVMSADGRTVAVIEEDDDDATPRQRVTWLGAGAKKPLIDLGCRVKGCSEKQRATLDAALAAAAFVACPDIGTSASFDGHEATLESDGGLWLVVDGRRRWLANWQTIDDEAVDGLVAAYQVPDGPIHVRTRRGFLSFDDVALGLCASGVVPPPARLMAPAPWSLDDTREVIPIARLESGPVQRDESDYHFGASSLVDGFFDSAWQPKAAAGEAGASFDLILASEATVLAIDIANGFQRSDALGDLFTLNARARQVTLTFSDGSKQELTLADGVRGFVRFELAPRVTRKVHVSVVTAYPGSRWPDDVSISEVRLLGAPK